MLSAKWFSNIGKSGQEIRERAALGVSGLTEENLRTWEAPVAPLTNSPHAVSGDMARILANGKRNLQPMGSFNTPPEDASQTNASGIQGGGNNLPPNPSAPPTSPLPLNGGGVPTPEQGRERTSKVATAARKLFEMIPASARANWRTYVRPLLFVSFLAAGAAMASQDNTRRQGRTLAEELREAPSWRAFVDPSRAKVLSGLIGANAPSLPEFFAQEMPSIVTGDPATLQKVLNLPIENLLHTQGGGVGLSEQQQEEVSAVVSALMNVRYVAGAYSAPTTNLINTTPATNEYGNYSYDATTVGDLYSIAKEFAAKADQAYQKRTA